MTGNNKGNSHIEILIAEDSVTQAEQLEMVLQGEGYTTTRTGDGEEALAAARRRKPALIISDIMMPKLDGYGLCKAIKSDDVLKDIPVMLVTTLSDPDDVIHGLECGADNFISKPFDERYLLSRIKSLLTNLDLRESQRMHTGVEISLAGRKHFITAERQQILDLLISTYEQAIQINQELKLRNKEVLNSNQTLQGLYKIAESLNSATTERAVAESALEQALKVPEIKAGWISLWDGNDGFRLAAARNLPPALERDGAMEGLCKCRRMLLNGDLDSVTNIVECERLKGAKEEAGGLYYHASVPLWNEGQILGMMNLAGPDRGMFDEEAFDLLYSIGNQVAVALERARLHEYLEQKVEDRTAELRTEIEMRKQQEARVTRLNRFLSVLSEINTTIVRVRERDELFEAACRIAIDAGEFVFAWIGILDNDRQRLIPVTQAGHDDGYLSQIHLTIDRNDPDGCPLIAETLARSEPVICNDIASDAGFERWREAALERGYRSTVMLPLMLDSRQEGMFVLYASEPNVFDDEEMRLLIETAGDISFALDHIRKARQLNYLAYYDEITELPNRTLLYDRLQQAIAEAMRHGRIVSVAELNLDRFKTVNDSLGHSIGDRFLKAVGARFASTLRDGDTVARLSADEFGFVLADMRHKDDAKRIVDKTLGSLVQPFDIDGHKLFTSASLGMAFYPEDGRDPEKLLRNADVAMHRIKGTGRSVYQYYTDDMAVDADERLSLETALRHALEKQEFMLHYQPLVSLSSGEIIGVEALIRWQRPERGLVSPADFIPLAEETGLILQLGEWVLHTACKQAQEFQKLNGAPAIHMAVNLSPRQFQQSDLADVFIAIIKRTGLDPALLTLEITESQLMQNMDAALAMMQRLGDIGIKFSIDDFGTGYSSLAYLKDLPINYLKIDRSFVCNLPDDEGDSAIATTIISMARSLGKGVIAEGVETKAQMDFLREHGCGVMQGYYFSPPLPPDELGPMLKKGYLSFPGT